MKGKKWLGVSSCVLALASVVGGCSADGDGGGSAGAGGGDQNEAGAPAAGRAPDAGRGGGAGTAGMGPGGESGLGGSSGSGGVCDGEADEEQEPLFDLSQCPDRPNFLQSTCGEALTRETLRCGAPGNPLDRDCCQRAACDGDAGCGAGELCIPRLTQSPDAFGGSIVHGCSLKCGECSCAGTADIDTKAYCIPAADVEVFDCNVTNRTCDELLRWHANLGLGIAGVGAQPLGFGEQRTDECLDRVEQALATECERACTCSGNDCSMPAATFCPFEEALGCPLTLERAKTPDDLCKNDISAAFYSKCADGTERFEFAEYAHDTYELVFNPRTGNLYGARASGYDVGRICGFESDELPLIQAGYEPLPSTCEVCEFCGDEYAEIPECVMGTDGQIALP